MGAREPRGHLPGGEAPLRSGSSLPGGRYAVTELLDAGPVLMAYRGRDRWAEEDVLIHELLPIGCRRGPTAGPGANPYEATLHALRPAFLESVSRLMG
ncbi:MAG: hypothetical protein GF320_17485, partial [Armatimonadia bacterium]|nr:hypothetical protein [Armatimonadia bacterium]